MAAPERTARDEQLMREERRARARLREQRRAEADARVHEDDEEVLDEEVAGAETDAEAQEPPARRSRPDRRPARRQRPPRERRPRGRGSELLSRILVAVPLAIVAIIFDDVGGLAWALVMAIMSVLCLIELYRVLERWEPVAYVGYAAALGMGLVAHFGSITDVLELAMAAIPATFLLVVAQGRTRLATVSIAGTLLGVFWVGLGFAHAVLLRELPHGNAIVIDVMVGTFLADVGAYFGGRMFGHRPLAPSISPNKTVEGLALGMFTAVVCVFIAGRFQQTWLSEGDSLLLGLTIAVLGPLGDLFESLVKRDAGVKDAGTLFGAHGGALDRVDAVIFTAVGSYYVWSALLH